MKNRNNLTKEQDVNVEKIVRGLQQGYRQLIESRKKQRQKLVILKNGQITNIKM